MDRASVQCQAVAPTSSATMSTLHHRLHAGKATAAGRTARPIRARHALRVCAAAAVEPATARADAAAYTQHIVAEEAKYVLQTYSRPNLVFTEGHGAKLYDAAGKEYLDMAAGGHGWRGEA